MKPAAKTTIIEASLTVLFLGLAGAFLLEVWGRSPRLSPLAPVDLQFTNTATVRLSAAEQILAGGDTSGLDCYACHERNKPPPIKLDADNNVVLPKEHEDLVMRHGRNNRNNYCFNCHDPDNLDTLKTRDGKKYPWARAPSFAPVAMDRPIAIGRLGFMAGPAVIGIGTSAPRPARNALRVIIRTRRPSQP